MKNILFRKVLAIVFYLLAVFSLYAMGQPAYADDFEICRLSSDSRVGVDCSDERIFTSTFTPSDRDYYEHIKPWHISATEELERLDPRINASPVASGYRNLCLLRVSIVYKTDTGERKTKTRDIDFENIVFLSGGNL